MYFFIFCCVPYPSIVNECEPSRSSHPSSVFYSEEQFSFFIQMAVVGVWVDSCTDIGKLGTQGSSLSQVKLKGEWTCT